MNKYLIFFTIFFIACNQTPEVDNFKISGSGEYITLTTDGSINPKTKYIEYYENEGQSWLFYGNETQNEFIIYKLPSGEVEKRLTFNKRGPDGIGTFRGMLVHSFDTIFLVSATYYNSFYLTDTTGRIKQKYTLEYKGANRKFPPAIKPLYNHNTNPGIYQHGKINLSTYVFTYVKNEDLHNEILDFEYDIKNKIITDTSKYPLFEVNYNARLSHHTRTHNGRQFVYSFQNLDDIHYQNIDGNYTKYFCGSRYLKKDLDWTNNSWSSIIEQKETVIENPRYFSIIYDKHQKVYYRFFKPGYDLDEKEDIEKNADYPKLFSIIMLDENFNLMGETLLPENTYDPYMKFVGKDGLCLALHFDHPLYNPDSLKFERMDLLRK